MGLSEDAQETVRGFRDTLILWRISEESPAGGRDGGMVHSEIAQFACRIRCVRSLASRQKLVFEDNNHAMLVSLSADDSHSSGRPVERGQP